MEMESEKKGDKSFVDKYFPVKQSNHLKSETLEGLFPTKNHAESWKKQESMSLSKNSGVQKNQTFIPTADGNSNGSHSRSQNTYQKGSNPSVFIEASDPCPMSSSVDYGCRDYYPSSKQYQGGFDRDKDRKDGYDYPDPENSRGEWWQGSLYY